MPRFRTHPRHYFAVLALGLALVVVLALWTVPRWLVPILADRFPGCIYSVETSVPAVALTIDDGPDASTTPTVLRALRDHDARATFFLISGTSRLTTRWSLRSSRRATRSPTTSRAMRRASAFRRRRSTPRLSPPAECSLVTARCGGLDLAVVGTTSAWWRRCANAATSVRSDPSTRTTRRYPPVASVRPL